jgi:hypothetical protein
VIGDLSRVLRHLAPTAVLAEGTYALNGAGQAADQYRAPYAALAVTSFSSQQLTISSSPPQASVPGPGPGSAIVPPRGFRVVNMSGYAWSLYGGEPGELVTVEAFTRPQAAHAAFGPAAGFAGPATVYNAGFAVGPAAGTAIAILPVLPAGWWTITIAAGFGGTAETTTPNNFQLTLGAAVLYPALAVPLAVNAITQVGRFRVRSDGAGQIALRNPVAAAPVSAFYQGSLQADQ